jgi:8-oxo-dGTP pyrophosphatase MutT (NUDIX family)
MRRAMQVTNGEWTYESVVRRVAARLAEPLPGLAAQSRMAPRPRRGWDPLAVPAGVRPAAALLLIYPRGGDAHLVLTVRATTLPQHAGQVSLPGGAVDEGESIAAAALREAWEEVGVDPASVELLGALTPLHIPVSGFMLHPLVGATPAAPVFAPHVREVAQVAEVSIAHLAAPDTQALTRWVYEGREYEIPYFDVDGLQVWGATAMVLGEFLAVLGGA